VLPGLVLVGPASSAQASAFHAYPPTICPTLSVSTTKPAVGETIGVTGENFDPDKAVTLILHSKTYVLKTVKTNSSGSFSADVKLPSGLTGNHTLSAKGAQSACPADPIQIVISGAPATSRATAPNGGPAFTGVDILGLLLAAAALIGVGLLLNRRRGANTRHDYTSV